MPINQIKDERHEGKQKNKYLFKSNQNRRLDYANCDAWNNCPHCAFCFTIIKKQTQKGQPTAHLGSWFTFFCFISMDFFEPIVITP